MLRLRRLPKLAARVVLLLCATTHAQAVIGGNWLTTDGGAFNDAASWSSRPYLPSRGAINFVGTNGGSIAFDGSPLILNSIGFQTFTQVLIGPAPLQLINGALDNEHVSSDSLFGSAILAPTLSGGMIGTAGVLKSGNGEVYLSGANTFTGTINAFAGTLSFADSSALGDAGNPIVLRGGAIRPIASSGLPIIVARPITASAGALNTIGGSATFNGGISGTGGLQFDTDNTTLTAANSYNGYVYVRGGGTSGLTLSGNGSLASITGLDLYGQLILSNTGQAVSDRLADTGTLTLHSSTIELDGNGSASVSEIAGAATLTGGGNTLRVTQVGTVATGLTFGALTRTNHATLSVQAPTLYQAASPGANLSFSNAASFLVGNGGAIGPTTLSILPFAIEDSSAAAPRLLTAVGTQLRPLKSSEYQTNLAAATVDSNVQLTADANLSTAGSVNALLIPAATLGGSGVLTVRSGLIAGAGTISSGVNFGSGEGIVFGTHVVGPISGSAGVTYDPAATAYTTVPNPANSYSGQTTLNGGTLVLSADVLPAVAGPFGKDSSAIVLSNGATPSTLSAAAGTITIGRDLTVDGTSPMRSSNASSLTGHFAVNGATNLNGPLHIAGDMTFNGSMNSYGTLLDTSGQNSVTLNGDNSYYGGTLLRNGTINLGNDTALGTGTLTLNGSATLSANQSARSLSNSLFFDPANSGTTLNFAAASPAISFAGNVDLGATAATVNVFNASDSFGYIVANGTLNKLGSGTLRIGKLGTTVLNINSGLIQLIAGQGVSQSGSITFANGGRIDLTSNGLIETYAPGANLAATVHAEIEAGSFTSSSAVAGRSTIGWADNATLGLATFAGTSVSGRSILLRNTYLGDCNLDGKVDIGDLGILATHWQKAGTWQTGDFDDSGKVDIGDLGELATNWQAGVAGANLMTFQQALAEVGLGDVAVPEPVGAATALLLFGGAAARRNRWGSTERFSPWRRC